MQVAFLVNQLSGMVTALLARKGTDFAAYGGPTVGELTSLRPATDEDMRFARIQRGFGINREGVRILFQEVR